jgi:hypothetical protein
MLKGYTEGAVRSGRRRAAEVVAELVPDAKVKLDAELVV